MNNNMIFIVVDTLASYNTWNDLKLIRISKEIESPKIKKSAVSIEGRDGEYDLSEYFGEIKFENRKLSFSFVCKEIFSDFDSIYAEVLNKIHGKKVKVVLPEDSEFYYVGRCEVNTWKTDKTIGSLVIDVNAEPYKYKHNKTVVSVSVTSEAQELVLTNERMSVVPEFTCTGETTITFGNITHTMNAGTHIFADILLKQGENVLTVSGSGTLTVLYQEGAL